MDFRCVFFVVHVGTNTSTTCLVDDTLVLIILIMKNLPVLPYVYYGSKEI